MDSHFDHYVFFHVFLFVKSDLKMFYQINIKFKIQGGQTNFKGRVLRL